MPGLPRQSPTSRNARDGTVLLEVVLALVLFVAAAAIIGGGLSASVQSVDRLRLQTHAADLGVSVLAEVHIGLRPLITTGPTPFGPPFQDWTWELIAAPHSPFAAELTRYPLHQVEVIIRHQSEPIVFRLSQVLAPDAIQLSAGRPDSESPVSAPPPADLELTPDALPQP